MSSPSHPPSLEMLPNEVMSLVFSFIGPTSPTLVRLAQVNQHLKTLMYRIGQQMLQRARNFNEGHDAGRSSPLSSICLFVKHANPFQSLYERSLVLQSTLGRVGEFKTGRELDEALDSAIEILLGSIQLCPTFKGAFVGKTKKLEELILRVCGRAGAVGFKASKLRLQMVRWLKSSPGCVGKDREQLLSKEAIEQARLDKSKLVIQSVVSRDFQKVRCKTLQGMMEPKKKLSVTTSTVSHLTPFATLSPGSGIHGQHEGLRRICLFMGALKRYRDEVVTEAAAPDDRMTPSAGKRRKVCLR